MSSASVPTIVRSIGALMFWAVLTTACVSGEHRQSATPSPSETGSGSQRAFDTPGYALTVSGVADLSVAATSKQLPTLPVFLHSTGPSVDVDLNQAGQPAQPLTLRFDFTGKSDPQVSPALVPAVATLADGSDQVEVLKSQWDSARHTLTAQSQHLSTFFPVSIDFTALTKQFNEGLKGYLGLGSSKPGCVGQPLRVGDITYALDPPSVPAAWPCLSRFGDKISVDLVSNSPNGWMVQPIPATSDMTVDGPPDVGTSLDIGAYRTIFSGVVGDGTFLLPGDTTHLRFDPANPPQSIQLRADPGVSLLSGLLLGLHSVSPTSKVLDILGMTDCLKVALSAQTGPIAGGPDLGGGARNVVDCITNVTATISTKPVAGAVVPPPTIASKTLGTVLSMGPDVAQQLGADLSGAIGEFSGANSEVITVRESAPIAPPSGPATLILTTTALEAGGAIPLGPDHFKIGNQHDRGGYHADVSYRWTINRPPGSNLGYCKGHVTVTNDAGAVINHWDDNNFNACEGGGSWATDIRLYTPGVFTVTADVEMEHGPTLHGTRQFVVDPH
jgi:hypothetical protein